MFEIFDGHDYKVYDQSINPSGFDWKEYPTKQKNNSQGLSEIVVDLSDAVISGTDDSFIQMN